MWNVGLVARDDDASFSLSLYSLFSPSCMYIVDARMSPEGMIFVLRWYISKMSDTRG